MKNRNPRQSKASPAKSDADESKSSRRSPTSASKPRRPAKSHERARGDLYVVDHTRSPYENVT